MADPGASVVQGDATHGVIPYKNPPALIAYYCAIFSIIPFLGFFSGVPAVILGVVGLRARAANPVVRGGAHAWIGIILGGLMTLLWGGLIGLPLLAALTR